MEGILKQEYMVKRSIMKGFFKSENYKGRWFVLTSTQLTYHDGSPDDKPGKIKGTIPLRNIKAVETIEPEQFGDRPNAFQIVFNNDAGETYYLYALALTPESQKDWIRKIRQASEKCGAHLFAKYHPGVYHIKLGKWLCCEKIQRQSEGCVTASKSMESKVALPVKKPLAIPADTSKANNESTVTPPPRNKVVQKTKPKIKALAIYSYQASEKGDLSLIKGEEYEILERNEECWWKAKNSAGEIGFIPVSYVKVKENEEELEEYEWYYPHTSRMQAEEILKREGKDGCFLVREARTGGMYTLSIFARDGGEGVVKHYHIKAKSNGDYYLTEKHAHRTLPDLIHYHKHNAAGLIVRLRSSPSAGRENSAPTVPGLSHDVYEIKRTDLQLGKTLGSGQFGEVKAATYKGKTKVAVKIMKEGSMSEDDFIEEAKTMKALQHNNLVRLFGICIKEKPLYIVTELMAKGSLLSYMKKHQSVLNQRHKLVDWGLQVAEGMAYLEAKSFIHRDLAARNCLLDENDVCKIGDFGLTRFVLDNEYTSSHGTKFPIRWAPPEVLSYTRFSTKSDVWSYGILMWEIFSGGSMPYGRSTSNQDVVNQVCHQKKVLDCPDRCPRSVYDLMLNCWRTNPEERPDFADIKKTIAKLAQAEADYV